MQMKKRKPNSGTAFLKAVDELTICIGHAAARGQYAVSFILG
jgi:hypothetical protein